jgi:hypothetical protein
MTARKLIDLLIPTPFQIAGCVAVAFIVLLLAYWNIIIRILADGFGINQATLAVSLTHQVGALDNIPYASRIPGVIFWFIVLLTMYVGYLKIHNALIELYNEYVVATEFTGQPSWWAHGRQIVPRIVLYIGFLVFVVVSWKLLGLWWLELTGQYFWSLFMVQYLSPFLVGLLGITLNLYVLLVLVQLIVYE